MQLIQYAPDDRDGAQAAAADRAALDQQVLRARSDAGEILHQMVRRPGADRVRHLLGQPGRQPRAEELRGLHARGPARGARRDRAGDRRARRCTRIGYCVGGTLLAVDAGLHGRPTATTASRRRRLFAAQVDFTHAGDLKVFVDEEQIAALEREMAERGYLEGTKMAQRLQHAALERPDLALRHQQLPQGQGADAVRPAVLELRRHPHAGGQPLVLPAQLLPGEQAHQGQDGARRRASSISAR